MAVGHNKSFAAPGCKRSLAGPPGQLKIVKYEEKMSLYIVVAVGHNKSFAAFGCKRSLAGPLGQLDIYSWPFFLINVYEI